jgi:hypothetical protein
MQEVTMMSQLYILSLEPAAATMTLASAFRAVLRPL